MDQCLWKYREGLASHACLELSSTPLDKAITDRLVGAITPVTIELALAALQPGRARARDRRAVADADRAGSR
jgi:hypothetical protein